MVDRSKAGAALSPVVAHVEPGRLRFFRTVIGDAGAAGTPPDAGDAARRRDMPIPPTYLFCLEMLDADSPFEFVEALSIDIARVLHGEQSFAYKAPVFAGDVLTFRTTVADITDKKRGALTLVKYVTGVTNQHDVDVAELVKVLVVRNGAIT